MKVLVVYDINEENGGTKRLNKVAKICEKYGNRVQDSVFEVEVDFSQIRLMEHELEDTIQNDLDSVRLYKIGKSQSDIKILGKSSRTETMTENVFIL